MPPANRRSRSTTTASTQSAARPLSRGSTTSVPSAHAPNVNPDSRPSTAYAVPQHHSFGHSQEHYAPLDASHAVPVHATGDGTGLDPSLAAWNQQFSEQAVYGMPNGIPPHVQHSQQSFDQMQDVQYAYSNNSQHASQLSLVEDKPKKGSASSATNDKELREMLSKNQERSLKDVATEVISTERTSRAEKTKQLFAMIWLKTACKAAKTSVPRSRVYSTYAETCATERVQPLNPASFGKLVRVIFPGLQTRRLGVRGESKYHYVDLALVDDPQMDYPDYERRGSVVPEGRSMHSARNSVAIDFNSLPRMAADTATFPPTDSAADARFQAPQPPSSSVSHGRLFANPYDHGVNTRHAPTSTSYKQTLKFPPQQDYVDDSEVIELPSIHDYVPPRTDADAALSLAALYRTHCTSLVDCVRYCKEKQFFRLYGTFSGTLTVPVQKLFEHPAMAIWIRECDILMYQKMTHFISQLTLAVVPPVVLRFFDTVSKTLHAHISKIFADKPAHVLEAKLEPATLFAGLLHRMLRVNAAAHAAATLLMQDQYRDQMWQDWVAFVNPKRVMESELPDCGYDEAYRILTYDVRMMLQPLSTPYYLEEGTHYQHAAFQQQQENLQGMMTSETVIERIANFLGGLAVRFPDATTRTLLHCVSAVGTAALREITVENGTSYNPWWITKVFIDEMSLWLASLGGFLDHKPSSNPREVVYRQQADTPLLNGRTASHSSSEQGGQSRQSSVNSPALPQMQGTSEISQAAGSIAEQRSQLATSRPPPTGQFSFRPHQIQIQTALPAEKMAAHIEQDDAHDDSGIGMSLIDDSGIDLHKFDMSANANMETSMLGHKADFGATSQPLEAIAR